MHRVVIEEGDEHGARSFEVALLQQGTGGIQAFFSCDSGRDACPRQLRELPVSVLGCVCLQLRQHGSTGVRLRITGFCQRQ